MSTTARAIVTIVLLGALALVSGCAFLRGSATGSSFVTGDTQYLRLPGAHDSHPNAVGYRSPYGYQEYARSTTNGRAEAVLLRTRPPGIAIDMPVTGLASVTQQWNFNQRGARLTWSRAPEHRIPGTSITYRRYQRRGSKNAPARACVAFIRAWAKASDDPLNRPTRAYFGYYCRPPGQSLSASAAKAHLRQIDVASLPLPSFYLGQKVPHDAAAEPYARGAQSPDWGINGFPLHRFRHYPVGGTGGKQSSG